MGNLGSKKHITDTPEGVLDIGPALVIQKSSSEDSDRMRSVI